jgi:hypothetical protein
MGSDACRDVHFRKVKANSVRLVPLEKVLILKSPYYFLHIWYRNDALAYAFNTHIRISLVSYPPIPENSNLIVGTRSDAANSL